jgi:hypothetical protein
MPKRPSRAQHPSSPGSVGAASVDEKQSTNFSSNGGAAIEPREAVALAPYVGASNGSQNGDPSGTPCHCWPSELDQFLKQAAKGDRSHERTSIALIRQAYPQLSKAVIWDRIVYLGLTRRKRPPYEEHEWTQAEDDILRAEYGLGYTESNAAIDKILRLHPTWSRDTVIWRANVLGLTHRRPRPPQKWCPALDNALLSLMGCQLATIAERLRRSPKSIMSRLRKLGKDADFFGGYKTKDLMRDLNVTDGVVNRWVRLGWLVRKKRRITEESLCSLCRHHPEEIPFATLSPELQNWLTRSMGYRPPAIAAETKALRRATGQRD